MKFSCRYLTDGPKDNRVAVLDSSGVEYILRVLGHPAEVNPPIEIVSDCNLISAEQLSELKNQVLKFHFGVDDFTTNNSETFSLFNVSLNQALQHFLRAEYELAVPFFVRAQKFSDPSNFATRAHLAYNLAICYLITEKLNEAEVEIRDYIKCDPGSADGPCLLSTIQLKLENFLSAEKNALKAIELGCYKCIVANKNLAFALKGQGKLSEAIDHFIKYMNKSSPSCTSGHQVLIELLGGDAVDHQI